MKQQIAIIGNSLKLGSVKHDFEHKLKLVEIYDDKIIILFDPDSYIKKFGQFNNIVAIDFSGNKIWTAELPTNSSGDLYLSITSRDPLIAYSIKGFDCEIDTATGKVNAIEFIK